MENILMCSPDYKWNNNSVLVISPSFTLYVKNSDSEIIQSGDKECIGRRGDKGGVKCDFTMPYTTYFLRSLLIQRYQWQRFSVFTSPTGTQPVYHFLKNGEKMDVSLSKFEDLQGSRLKEIEALMGQKVVLSSAILRYMSHALPLSFQLQLGQNKERLPVNTRPITH